LIYNCSSNGCIYFDRDKLTKKANTNLNLNNDENLLVIKQTKYLVRAVSIMDGEEKWNLTLTKNDIIKHPKTSASLDSSSNGMFIGYDQPYGLTKVDEIESMLLIF
jgi:hypothetical protein